MNMKQALLQAAEHRARLNGYNGFSFRDIAADVGIKSASVHHHFPTKDRLVEELASWYLEKFRIQLGSAEGLSTLDAFDQLAAIFVTSNERDGKMCLCGILGAEASLLPKPVLERVSTFFDFLADWLGQALAGSRTAPSPQEIVAALEGGLLISRAKQDPAYLRNIVKGLRERVS